MITQKFTCDRCGASSETLGTEPGQIQLWNMHLQYTAHPSRPSQSTFRPADAQWCRTCMVELELLTDSRKKEEVSSPHPHKPVTLEDIVRELIREELEP